MRVRKRPGVVVLFVLIAVAGFASTLALGSAHGGILPTLSVPSLPVSVPVTTALPPAPPLPPPPPVPPAPPPTLPPASPPPALPPAPPILHGATPPAPSHSGSSGSSGSSGAPGSSSGTGPSGAPASASQPSVRNAATGAHVSRARFHTSGPGRRGTTITFHLTAPATVVLLVHGPSPSCGLAGRRVLTLGRGVSRVRFLGRFQGRPLAPGTYGITMVARRGGRSTMLGRLAVSVVPPGQRIEKSSARPVFAGCERASATSGAAAPGAPSEPFAGLGLVLQTAAAHVVGPKASFRPPKLSVPVPRAPQLPGSSGAGSGWLAVLFYVVVMLAGAALLMLVLGFAKQRSNA
jgi:hypothetical protein